VKLDDYEKLPTNRDKDEGDAKVKCNALYKTSDNINAKLTPYEAIELARGLLMKAQTILVDGLEDAAVHLWNQGKDNETLWCGFGPPRKGPRTGRRRAKAISS
jgi:hypothetical protein